VRGGFYQKFGRDAALSGVVSALVMAQGVVLIPVLTKTIALPDYGIWNQISVTVEWLTVVSLLGLDSALPLLLPTKKAKEVIRQEFLSSLGSTVLTAVVLSGLLLLLADSLASLFLGGQSASPFVRAGAWVVIATTANRLCLAYFRAFRQVAKYSILLLVETYGQIFLTICFVLSGYGLWGAIYALLAVRSSVLVIAFWLIVREVGLAKPRLASLPSYLALGLPVVPALSFLWMVRVSSRYAIGFFLGPRSVGIYSAAYGGGMLVTVFFFPVLLLLPPSISTLWEKGQVEEVGKVLQYSTKYALLLTIPMVFALSILAKPVLALMATPDYVEGAILLPFIGVAQVAWMLSGVAEAVIGLVRRTWVFPLVYGVCALLNLILNVLLIPRLGILGAAISMLIAYLTLPVMTFAISSRHLLPPTDIPAVAKSIAASIVMSLVIWRLRPGAPIELAFSAMLGATTYFVVLLLLKSFEEKEVRFFKQLIVGRKGPL
jgi:O-antigen/teichoic acid export membrane protein